MEQVVLGPAVMLSSLVLSTSHDAPGGWPLVDAARIHRHAALGLFDESGALVPVQGRVTKSPDSPLFVQDKPWETRIDNGYPNVVYDPESAARGDGPWRLWYGDIGGDRGGQYLLYANSSDGIHWEKPDLNRYDLHSRWSHDPSVARLGKHNNIAMFGGGLGIYRDLHEKNASLRYKVSGGAPAGCFDDSGDRDCVVGTAGSPDGISRWSDVEPLGFAAPWRPDCHTNLFYDEPLGHYLMTTRSYEEPDGRLISMSRTGGHNRSVFVKNGSWALLYENEYPPTVEALPCFNNTATGAVAADYCAQACFKTPSCRYFWAYTSGRLAGDCCLKASVHPGALKKPSCPTCGGEFGAMDGKDVFINATEFDSWTPPVITMNGTAEHQLYSQITWRFYDILLGLVMTFDAADAAGHVRCMLSYSRDSFTWEWVDPAGLAGLTEFIPAGGAGSFDSHVCFAAHSPLRMPDGSTRVYYMGGNGPHSGARNSSFGLATLPPDRFAGMTSAAAVRTAGARVGGAAAAAAGGSGGAGEVAVSRVLNITGSRLLVTLDVGAGGSLSVGINGSVAFARSVPVTATGTDVPVVFEGRPAGLAPLVGHQHQLIVFFHGATTLYTVGFREEEEARQEAGFR